MTYEDLLSIRDSAGLKCRKKAYTTSRRAKEVAAAHSRRGRIEARVYKCPKCGKYHVTTTNIFVMLRREREINPRVTAYDIQFLIWHSK